MSHYLAIVILPEGTKPDCEAIKEAAEVLLEPFDENTSVTPYQKPCFCVGGQARKESHETARAETGTDMASLRDLYWKKPEVERTDEAWEAMIAPYVQAQEKAFEAHPLKAQPSPQCEDCEGSGLATTTYNPQSKWDWWQIGGRWDRALTENAREKITENALLVKHLPEDTSAWAILTPDGQWHEQARMGWWGVSSDDSIRRRKEWLAEMAPILGRFSKHIAVGVDLHI